MNVKESINPMRKIFRQKHFIVSNTDKQHVGQIACNWNRRLWKITDHAKNLVVIHFFKEGSLNRGNIEAPLGTFKVKAPTKNIPIRRYKGYRITTKCVVTDLKNQSCFSVRWVDCESKPKLSREYVISIQALDKKDLFFTATVAMCLIEKYMRSYKMYDHTPDTGFE